MAPLWNLTRRASGRFHRTDCAINGVRGNLAPGYPSGRFPDNSGTTSELLVTRPEPTQSKIRLLQLIVGSGKTWIFPASSSARTQAGGSGR